ncbi:putative wd40 repeat pf20 [Cadophora sp. MPI-SDFR-AT-0126]|nr:putative wd40 repeat pf20 [Leotiomycetes sp. MPI-SDFR-AT-0126]
MGKTWKGIQAILSLETHVPATKSPNLHAFIHDAKRFALYNRSIIEHAPLQLYFSALIFAPERSIIRRQFEQSIPTWIQRKPRVQADWSAALQTLEGHSSWVKSVAFSPNGMQIVSGSDDRTVRLWDAATGALLQTLEGHSDLVSSVAFSPEGNLVVSVTNKAVRLGDAATGALLHTLDGHSSWVRSVALFPHDKLLPTLHVSNHWLAEGTTSFLWLPTDYRPICKAVRDRVVIFGHSAGRISLLQIGKGSKCIVSN